MPFTPLFPRTYLMYQDSEHLHVCLWQRGRLLEHQRFLPLPGDIEQFRQYLEQRKDHHFLMLVNVAEEGYQLETVPVLRGEERRALIQRKMNQNFPATLLSTAFSLNFSKGWRKDERLLLCALTNPSSFDPWLGALRMTQQPFVGLYALAQLGPLLLARAGVRSETCLLLTLQDHTLRESLIVRGHSHFSRLTPLRDPGTMSLGEQFATEVARLHQYLGSQRLVAQDACLPVYILVHPAAMAEARQYCRDTEQLQFHFLDIHRLASRIGLQERPVDSRTETLFLHLLARHAPAQQFAGEGLRRDYYLSLTRLGLMYGSTLLLLGSLLLSGMRWHQAQGLESETRSLVHTTRTLDQRYRSITATFPKLDIGFDELQALTRRYLELAQQTHHPLPAWRQLSMALDQSPEVELDHLEWFSSSELASSRQGNVPGQPVVADRGRQAGSLPVGTPSAPVSQAGEVLVIHGHLQLAGEVTPRQIVGTFTDFQRRLKAIPHTQVEVVTPPIDFTSGKDFRASQDARQEMPAFVLRLHWRADK